MSYVPLDNSRGQAVFAKKLRVDSMNAEALPRLARPRPACLAWPRQATPRPAARALGASERAYRGWEAGHHRVLRYIMLAVAALQFGLPPFHEPH